MSERLYYGLNKIAERLDVSRDKARRWCREEVIRAYKSGRNPNGTWYCIESELAEDIKNLPGKL